MVVLARVARSSRAGCSPHPKLPKCSPVQDLRLNLVVATNPSETEFYKTGTHPFVALATWQPRRSHLSFFFAAELRRGRKEFWKQFLTRGSFSRLLLNFSSFLSALFLIFPPSGHEFAFFFLLHTDENFSSLYLQRFFFFWEETVNVFVVPDSKIKLSLKRLVVF